MTVTATPIPTVFQGVHFRSRLEARWAYFFERIGCGWEYEPAGVVLHFDGQDIPYAPDFKLSTREWVCHAEVKPYGIIDEQRDPIVANLYRFAEAQVRSILLLEGCPGESRWNLLIYCRKVGTQGRHHAWDWAADGGFDRWTVQQAENAANGTWWDKREGRR